MSILYITNSPATDNLERCLQRMADDDALLLIENAVTALNTGHQAEVLLANSMAKKNIYALIPDTQARGIQLSQQLCSIALIDYEKFVELATQHELSCYWK